MRHDGEMEQLGAAPIEGLAGDAPFPRIDKYGFLSDCEATALVAPSGNVEGLCLPEMDSPSASARS
jgi:hypothetical protein